ncbi:P-loop containing nucleoside triphosphate hydrolase protein [Blyttiomyces helicus]|uniref:P-loop containing nucleoside triphosphate hydrolase protein n=1 Tax=Blyttiomyces helicus TaxID=388810 RepID=A0A4P9VXS8_9FUNG|nr:P-loop containing nucleoside triphosphate hydrolase protein [Blyttiomyces helicus]|eukprot:RKO83523.1 P-loop containing nucleoside triphosphate hydrolase protein [Blyttiomyces helicus]
MGVPVKVFLRVRPPASKANTKALELSIEKDANAVSVNLPPDPAAPTRVYDRDVGADDVYATGIAQLVAQFLDGWNVGLLAAGATGSGKTFTLEGSKDGKAGGASEAFGAG